MIRRWIFWAAAAGVAACVTGSARAEAVPVYFGTYTGSGSEGIYGSVLNLETGELSEPILVAETKNPSFLEIAPGGRRLYAVGEVNDFEGRPSGGVHAYAIDPKNFALTHLNSQPSGGGGACHVSLDPRGKVVLTANYGGGSVASLPVTEGGHLGEPESVIQHEGSSVNPQRQREPHAHSINTSSDGRFAYAADLGTDKIMIYRLDTEAAALTPNDPPFAEVEPGSGPRHFTFRPDGKFAYVINELTSTITAFRWNSETGALDAIETVSTLPDGFDGSNSTAEVRAHPSGKFLYGSNRGHDSIAVFRIDESDGTLEPVEHEPTGGSTPRNFNIDPTGKFLLAANQGSDDVHVFRIDQESGALTATGHKVSIAKPVCVRFLDPITLDGDSAATDGGGDESGFRPLFDGESFDGWEGDMEWFRIEDGAIVAGSLEREIPRNEFLASTEEFADFDLRLEARLIGDGHNAGIQFRSQRIPDDHEMIGYQCDIGNSGAGGIIWGRIYDESRRRTMLSEYLDEEKARAALNENGWNDIRILAAGPRIRIWLNGVQTADYTEPDPSIPQTGKFGLQIHSGERSECRYRSIRIREVRAADASR